MPELPKVRLVHRLLVLAGIVSGVHARAECCVVASPLAGLFAGVLGRERGGMVVHRGRPERGTGSNIVECTDGGDGMVAVKIRHADPYNPVSRVDPNDNTGRKGAIGSSGVGSRSF